MSTEFAPGFCNPKEYYDEIDKRVYRDGLRHRTLYEISLKFDSQDQRKQVAKRLAIMTGEVIKLDDEFYKVPLRIQLAPANLPSTVGIFADGLLEAVDRGQPRIVLEGLVAHQAYLRLYPLQPGGKVYEILEEIENAERAAAFAQPTQRAIAA